MRNHMQLVVDELSHNMRRMILMCRSYVVTMPPDKQDGWTTFIRVVSNQALSSCVVNRSAKTRQHSCFHSDSSDIGSLMTSDTVFSMP